MSIMIVQSLLWVMNEYNDCSEFTMVVNEYNDCSEFTMGCE